MRTVKVAADGSIPDPTFRHSPEDDVPTGECPVCKGETDNYDDHGCDEDCRRGCNSKVPASCDTCATTCADCGEADVEKDLDRLCKVCLKERS